MEWSSTGSWIVVDPDANGGTDDGEEHTANSGEIVAGVLLAATGTFCASLANILVKTDHHKHSDKSDTGEQKPCYRRPIWYLIFTLYIVGGVLDFAAYGLAPLSLLAPVASLTIVMNAILAYFAFSEKLTYRDGIGSMIIIISAVVATAFGSRESAVIDLEGLLVLWRHELWLIFMSFELLAMVTAYALVHVWDPAWPGWSVWWRAYRVMKCGDGGKADDTKGSVGGGGDDARAGGGSKVGCCICCVDERDRPDASAAVRESGMIVVTAPIADILAGTDRADPSDGGSKEEERLNGLSAASASSDATAPIPVVVVAPPPIAVGGGDGGGRITNVDQLTSPASDNSGSSPANNQEISPSSNNDDPDAPPPPTGAVAAALAAVRAGRPLSPTAAISLMGRASVPRDPWSQSLHSMRAVMYAFLTSSAGAWTNILGKCCSALMRETAQGNNQWGRGESWAMLLALPFFAILQLRFMSEMMSIFEAVLIVPIYQCIFMIWLIICGQVYFQEFDKLPAKNIGIFFAAVAVCGFGVFILTRRPPPTEQQIMDQKAARLAKRAAKKAAKAEKEREKLRASFVPGAGAASVVDPNAVVTVSVSTPTLLTVPSLHQPPHDVVTPSESRGGRSSTDSGSGSGRPAFDLSPSAVAAVASSTAAAALASSAAISINHPAAGDDRKQLSETARLVPITSADSSSTTNTSITLLASSALSDSAVPVVQLTSD